MLQREPGKEPDLHRALPRPGYLRVRWDGVDPETIPRAYSVTSVWVARAHAIDNLPSEQSPAQAQRLAASLGERGRCQAIPNPRALSSCSSSGAAREFPGHKERVRQSSRSRLARHTVPDFAGDTLFDAAGRVVSAAECLPR